MADWLNRAFYNFDFALLEFGHNMHVSAGGFFDWFMKFVTVFGDGGIILILLSIGLIAFKKTRYNYVWSNSNRCYNYQSYY